MGGGSYNIVSSRVRASNYSAKSREEVFCNIKIDPEMDILNKPLRESRDSEEHPESFPIIIGLDVTGSMGQIPEYLIKEAFPTIMKTIIDAGIPNPQVCFMAFGDQISDRFPIQVGEFESSDELMEKWLTKIYIEQGGGGDGAETPSLIWWTALHHVVTDAWEKRNKKGVIITISDEANHSELLNLKKLFNFKSDNKRILTSKVLEQVQEKWEVYHINYKNGYRGGSKKTLEYWGNVLGSNCVHTEHSEGKDIVNIIPQLIIKTYVGDVEAGD